MDGKWLLADPTLWTPFEIPLVEGWSMEDGPGAAGKAAGRVGWGGGGRRLTASLGQPPLPGHVTSTPLVYAHQIKMRGKQGVISPGGG